MAMADPSKFHGPVHNCTISPIAFEALPQADIRIHEMSNLNP